MSSPTKVEKRLKKILDELLEEQKEITKDK